MSTGINNAAGTPAAVDWSMLDAVHGRRFSAAMSEDVNRQLLEHLLQWGEDQEDLTFALWTPSISSGRLTALVHTPILPGINDRVLHGNVAFNQEYLERALAQAAREGTGLAFLHSHPVPGWQDMSRDDVVAEQQRLAGCVAGMTDLPLLGLTCGIDGTWSARFWFYVGSKRYERRWCESVRVAGRRLKCDFNDALVWPPEYREQFKRTRTVWGVEGHKHLARLRVGIVGLGSVGMAVAEGLARSGIERFVLVDFDEVQQHNLDRLQGTSNTADVGRWKVDVAGDLIQRSATAHSVEVRKVPHSVVEEEGYRAALDCDVIFSCVDRPRARQILNHVAYAHLIPVLDGGIAVRFRDGEFRGAEWQAQTVAPGLACLECLGAFQSGDADTERNGLLDDPSYMQGLPADHRLKRSENVYPFSTNLASMEVMQFIALAAGLPQLDAGRVQRFYLVPGMMESQESHACNPSCDISNLVATGDTAFLLTGFDHAAAIARVRQSAT
jgi:molybdopterin/thiamine biosynthesis adenylyltransferase